MPSSWTLSYVLPRLYEGWHPQTLGEECSCHKAKGWAQSWRRTNDQMIPGSSRILQKCQNKIAKTRPDLPRAISSWLCSNTSPLRSDGVLWALQLQFVSTPAWWPDGECRARSEVFSQKLRTKQLQIHGFPGSRHCNPSMYQSCHHSLMKIWTIVKYEKCRGKIFLWGFDTVWQHLRKVFVEFQSARLNSGEGLPVKAQELKSSALCSFCTSLIIFVFKMPGLLRSGSTPSCSHRHVQRVPPCHCHTCRTGQKVQYNIRHICFIMKVSYMVLHDINDINREGKSWTKWTEVRPPWESDKQPANGSADCSSEESSDLRRFVTPQPDVNLTSLSSRLPTRQLAHQGRSPFSMFRRASGILDIQKSLVDGDGGDGGSSVTSAVDILWRLWVSGPLRRQQRSNSVEMVLLQFLTSQAETTAVICCHLLSGCQECNTLIQLLSTLISIRVFQETHRCESLWIKINHWTSVLETSMFQPTMISPTSPNDFPLILRFQWCSSYGSDGQMKCLHVQRGTWAGLVRFPTPCSFAEYQGTIRNWNLAAADRVLNFCKNCKICILSPQNHGKMNGNASLMSSGQSLCCCRDKAQEGAALQRRTPHLCFMEVYSIHKVMGIWK